MGKYTRQGGELVCKQDGAVWFSQTYNVIYTS